CSALDECHEAGACDAQTGMCSNPPRPDGTSCTGGTCSAGNCVSDTDGGGNEEGGGCGCHLAGVDDGMSAPLGLSAAAFTAICLARRRRRARWFVSSGT